MINLIAAFAIIASMTVYRLELRDERPFIVGADGVSRPVCLVDPSEYAMMTGRVDQVWRSLNSTESGRVQLHGSRVWTEVDETNGVKVVVYKDGYRHSEKFAVRRPRKKSVLPVRVRNRNISDRQQKFREAIEARKSAPPKVITIEHNAATGKDTELGGK